MRKNKRVVLAPFAIDDLSEIARYYIEVASDEAAEKVLEKVRTVVSRLDRLEMPGRPRDELLPGLRSVLASPYIVFFRLGDDRIEVVRVLHQRRDIPALFGDLEHFPIGETRVGIPESAAA